MESIKADGSTETIVARGLSIALIGPDLERRNAVVSVLGECQQGDVREYSAYPTNLDSVPPLLEQRHDVILLELDSHPEYALELVECICAQSQATVMVYSESSDPSLLIRSMRAGAREFLTLPFDKATVTEALVRVSARRPAARTTSPKKAVGRLLAFLGAKGGDGVTTLACNFAVSLAQESGQSTLLIDLDLPLGDAALNLGVMAQYSTINALENANRLDSSFLSTLLVKHSSGVSVLAAPGKFPEYHATDQAIDKLIAVARQEFDNVVIDMGCRLNRTGTSIFKEGATVYLVIQAGIAGLRNANRVISQYFSTDVPKLEIVLNRYHTRSSHISEEDITKALTRPAQWKIPNDYAAVRRMHHTAVPLALEDSPISRLIRQMSRTACGLPATVEKEPGEKRSVFNLRRLSRSIAGKSSSSEKTGEILQPLLNPDQEDEEELSQAEIVETDQEEFAANRQGEPETRIYKGARYVMGKDGQWHRQETQASAETAATEIQDAAAANAVILETPTISWAAPAAIEYGSALSVTQYMAMSSAPGRFVFNPAIGEVLPAGVHTLTATFIPADETRYTTTQASVKLTVNKAKPIIRWPASTSTSYGTALGAAHLNATASVPGSFVYAPASGAVLGAGVQPLTATFTPEDTANYSVAQAAVWITVTRATPIVTWPAPAPIVRGTALSVSQLNATALVPGSFTYSFAAGDVLAAGKYLLKATFTPKDLINYAPVQASAPLTVTKAKPVAAPPAAANGSTEFEAKPQPAAAEAETVQAAAPLRQELPAHEKAQEKASEKPPVESASKSLIKAHDSKFHFDAGSGLDLMSKAVFPDGTTIYLVMQPGSSGEQNSKHMVSQFLAGNGPKPEIVTNRLGTRRLGGGEGQSATAMTRSAHWPVSCAHEEKANVAAQEPEVPAEKKRFSLRGLKHRIFGGSSAGKADAFTQLGLAQGWAESNAAQEATAPAKQSEPETRIYKGATYARGADGQWHLQKPPAHAVNVVKAAGESAATVKATSARARKAKTTGKAKPAAKKAAVKAKQPTKAVPAQAKKTAGKAKPTPKKTVAKASAKAPLKTAIKTPAKAAKKAALKPANKL